jgi:hypothetical protein
MLERGVFSLLHHNKKIKGGQEDQILFVGANSTATPLIAVGSPPPCQFLPIGVLYGSITHSRRFSAAVQRSTRREESALD